MQSSNIIIGGGLSGLLTAWRLQQENLPYILLEAKAELGGRILGVQDQQSKHYYDLGPTWIFPHQHNIQNLLTELKLAYFDQYTQGDALFQKQNNAEVMQTAGAAAMTTYRVKGGMNALIDKIYRKLNPESIKTNHVVTQVVQKDGCWVITVQNKNTLINFTAKNLILALPPRMITQHLTPQHWASTSLQSAFTQVPTWMAAQAKYVATYASPFWRERALSGQAFSQQGPMQEMHDACADNSPPYALFGFIGIPAQYRAQYSEAKIKQACLNQLQQLYGERAKEVETSHLKDWATDVYVSTEQDCVESPNHPHFNLVEHANELKDKNIYLAGSEFSTEDAGYLEGAVCAVNQVISKLVNP
jgi:monoamine oxidase